MRIFTRKGKELEIFQTVNTAQADEMPSFTPGDRKWLLAEAVSHTKILWERAGSR